MIKQILTALAAALFTFAFQPDAEAQVPERIDWTIAPGGGDRVQLSLSYRSARGGHSNWSNGTALAELQGLEPAQLESDGSPARFRIVRDAGRFDCDGIVRRGRGTGECRFEPDSGFTAALAQRGIGRPTAHQQFQLALARVGLPLIDELERQRYARPGVEDLVRAGIHGVSADYVRDLRDAGYPSDTVAGLVRMRIHGVTADYVRELAAAGYRPDANLLQRLAIHDVSSGFIREMGLLGYGGLTAQELVNLRIHGLTAGYVREMRALGYPSLSADQLKRMRIHGVTADFVRRAIDRSGDRPSAEELIRMRIHGG